MDLKLYENLMRKPPDQNPTEWREFLTYLELYFLRLKRSPVVVEIGIRRNRQKIFYEKLLNCEHIGIDILAARRPDIVGDSHNRRTVKPLICALKGRPINLLFIDGDHTYEGVVADLKMYGMFTSHLVAIHDIYLKGKHIRVSRLWQELKANKHLNLIEFYHPEDKTLIKDMGIGVIIKR